MKALLIAVGSTNPAKIKAVENAFKKIFGQHIKVQGIKVSSGVSIQPLSDEEMVRGAINRAKRAYEILKPDFSVGLEGGVVKYSFGVFVKGWVAVYDGKKLGLASSISVPLPDYIWDLLVKGKARELEEIMEQISGIKRVGDSIGAIGVLTSRIYDRVKAFEDATVCAMAPFMSPNIFRARNEV
ncbi:MAG: inosine/xanthosine triphosphatase [Candidatus Njordarchaeales archaeon]